MLTLSFDTSERAVTAAVLREGKVLSSLDSREFGQAASDDSEQAIQFPRTSPGTSAITMPIIQAALKQAKVVLADIDLIALSKGPGLFTGLRVGVVTAKVLGFSLKKPIVAVNSLEVSAAEMARRGNLEPGSTIQSICNAQRKQLFAATYRVEGDEVNLVSDHQLVDRSQWIASINETDYLTGSGLLAIWLELPKLAAGQIAKKEFCQSNAIGVARLALKKFSAGQVDDPMMLSPIYFRPSAAEEKRNG
jgi:tRNA threonylcarbamoyladenosine biosynthesis protein TsaB